MIIIRSMYVGLGAGVGTNGRGLIVEYLQQPIVDLGPGALQRGDQ